MADEKAKSFAGTAAEAVATEIGTALGGAAGGVIVKVISHLGKTFLAYWLSADETARGQTIAKLQELRGEGLPPFAVVGLGRCGSHVTAQLARMVIDATPSKDTPTTHKASYLGRIFSRRGSPSILTIEPFMIVGDIDETTFADVDGIVGRNQQGVDVSKRMLRIDYRPLAHGGVGHVPVFGEFITRGLLLLPPELAGGHQEAWKIARSYLIDSCSRTVNPTRLVFYIFSSGGGTGGGSAPEIMRAQRFAITSSKEPDPEIYFAGVAVLPYDISLNKKHLINTGRAVVQYLAELNICLDSEANYQQAQDFQFGLEVEFHHGVRTVGPWDSLAFISNDVMNAPVTNPTREAAEARANQYIAQQIFNLAAGQLPSGSYKESGDIATGALLNFKSIRLDPADLRTGLSGPFAVGFSVSGPADTKLTGWLDRMFVRAIKLPHENTLAREAVETALVEGISVAPLGAKSEKARAYSVLIQKLESKFGENTDNGVNAEIIKEADLKDLTGIPLYKRCPQVVVVFTAPQDSAIPENVDRRLVQLLSWLMPNLNVARYAIVRGTTATYTLSIYMQGSVVLCKDVQDAIFNYLWLCWANNKLSALEFAEIYKKFVLQVPPVSDDSVLEAFGNRELYGAEAVNFAKQAQQHDERWQAVVRSLPVPPGRMQELLSHRVADCLVTPQEVASALRYLNYMTHVVARKPADAPDLG
jgi:hypothetical protein